MEDVVGGIGRVGLDAAMVVVAEEAPTGESVLEIAVTDEWDGIVGRRLHDADVIHQAFAVAEKAKDEIVPLRRAHDGLGDGTVAVRLPGGLGRFVAGGPGLGIGVVGVGVAQLETRAASVGIQRPAAGPAPAKRERAGLRRRDESPAWCW